MRSDQSVISLRPGAAGAHTGDMGGGQISSGGDHGVMSGSPEVSCENQIVEFFNDYYFLFLLRSLVFEEQHFN